MDYDTLSRKLDMLAFSLDSSRTAAEARVIYGRAVLLPGHAAARLASRALTREHLLQAGGAELAPAAGRKIR